MSEPNENAKPPCDCGVPLGQEAAWVHQRDCSWERALVCRCPADEAGARASGCLACRWSHWIGLDGLGCAWVRAEEARRDQEWSYTREIVLAALVAAGVDVIVDNDTPDFSRMRTDLWSPQQQSAFARHLVQRLEVWPVRDEMFAPHMTVNVVIGHIERYLRQKRLFLP